ncbi:hypothetical protein [Sphingobacterium paucimobilis]|uniref:Uncharacterized protein n=1 Tax=Sphingobacterium paucimobilis HER1398 TaxID=1346330 RepID=U2HT46_9SPHI|nr:hypothetical protein [Sphingobacterium paucimobilis]ERJ58667.1 hypothetical protein M472_07805 [Sphingobacterium paucimobilis HER1398]
MIKTYAWFLYLLLCSCIPAKALVQQNQDSISFETQRQRVNVLLDQRSKRFGDYTNSLEQKTGIFGLFKTKSDMQKSIDILKSVVINDNAIFLETRKLLDLKDSEADRFHALAKEYDQQVTAYMKTISKLQAENEKLRNTIQALEEEDHTDNKYRYVIFVILFLSGVLFFLYKRRRSKNLTKV